MRRLAIWLALFICCLAGLAQAHPVELSAEVDPPEVEMAGRLTYKFSAQWPAGWSITPPRLQEEEGMFDVVACQPPAITEDADGGGRLEMSCELIAFEPGEVELPTPTVVVHGPDDFSEVAAAPTVTVKVTAPVLEEQARPIKDPETVRRDWLKIALIALAVLAGLALLATAIYLLIRRRRRKRALAVEAKEPADERALRRLADEKLDRLFKEGNSKPYYSELTDIVREYLEGRFDLPAPERTTSEILREIEKQPFEEHRKFIADLLRTADLAKFAGVQVEHTRWHLDRQDSRGFVEVTRGGSADEEEVLPAEKLDDGEAEEER